MLSYRQLPYHTQADRQKSIRPAQTALQSGEFNDQTTNRADYIRKQANKLPAYRPENTALQSGEFFDKTTNRSDFDRKQAEKMSAYRPPNTVVQSGDFDGVTTHKADFVRKEGGRQNAIRPSSTTGLAEGRMDETTTMRHDFTEKSAERIIPVRPKSHEHGEGEFLGSSTYMDGFKGLAGDRSQSFRPDRTLHLSNASFDANTTQRMDFTKKSRDICPAERVLTHRDRSYEFSKSRNGHRYFHRTTHGQRVPSVLVPVS